MARLVRLTLISLSIALALFLFVEVNPGPRESVQRAKDWFMDEAGPEIEVELPSGYIHGRLTVRVMVRDESGSAIKSLAVDGKPLLPGPSQGGIDVDTALLPDGEHSLMVEAVDNSRRKNSSQRRFSFQTDNTPPQLTAQLEPPQVGQGHTLAIKIVPGEPVSVTGSLDGHSLTLLPLEDRYWAVVGFEPDSKIGPRSLDIAAVDKAGLETMVRIPVTVTRVDYPTEKLYIPEDRSGLLSPAITEAEIVYLAKLFAVSTPEKLWSGTFAAPARGETSSPFAIRRSYNDGPFGSHHGGIDLAIAEGAPVAAPNRGRVALAEPLKVRGNAVILDHGMGVYSAFYHLSQIGVRKDQVIEKGQTVGLVGNTGLSTGPHLHWEMRATGAAVDPLEWTSRTIP